jgi:MoaA/NifB/PqqE/SkfB family radical SAM enzyme
LILGLFIILKFEPLGVATSAGLRRLQIVVSIDGLQPEHDARRKPATYDRIVKHIEGHAVTVHCTVTSQQTRRPGYLEEFVAYWSANPNARNIWFSLYTPQVGEVAEEILTAADRRRVSEDLRQLRARYPKLHMAPSVIDGLVEPPRSPEACIFARTTTCYSSDLERRITPCQFGGTPDCSQCGCMASAGLAAVGRHRLFGAVPVGRIFDVSLKVGAFMGRLRAPHEQHERYEKHEQHEPGEKHEQPGRRDDTATAAESL